MKASMLVRRAIRKVMARRAGDPKYHFIHIPKNGGSSLRRIFERRGDISLTKPYHYRYIDIADEVGRSLEFFCTVRNPWARTASRYMFGRQNARRWAPDDPRRQFMATATFEEFIRDRRTLPIPRHPEQPWMGPLSSWYDQLEWIRDESGVVRCQCLRLERIDSDLSAYLGVQVKVPRRNVTGVKYDYRAMYTDELAECVGRLFKADIDYFGFTFDGPATRNIAVCE
jgi:hypothetical protein